MLICSPKWLTLFETDIFLRQGKRKTMVQVCTQTLLRVAACQN